MNVLFIENNYSGFGEIIHLLASRYGFTPYTYSGTNSTILGTNIEAELRRDVLRASVCVILFTRSNDPNSHFDAWPRLPDVIRSVPSTLIYNTSDIEEKVFLDTNIEIKLVSSHEEFEQALITDLQLPPLN